MTEKTLRGWDASELDGIATPWFALFERALRSEDYECAAVAKRELEARGVRVSVRLNLGRARRLKNCLGRRFGEELASAKTGCSTMGQEADRG